MKSNCKAIMRSIDNSTTFAIREDCQKYWDEEARDLEDAAQHNNLG